MGHFWLQIQFSIVLPQDGWKFDAILCRVRRPLSHCPIPRKTSVHDVCDGAPWFLYFSYFQAVFLYFPQILSTGYCTGLDDRYPIMSLPTETSGHNVCDGAPWFLVFSNRISVFRKKCISPKLRSSSTRYCAGLDDRYPTETSGHDVCDGAPQFLYFSCIFKPHFCIS